MEWIEAGLLLKIDSLEMNGHDKYFVYDFLNREIVQNIPYDNHALCKFHLILQFLIHDNSRLPQNPKSKYCQQPIHHEI